MRKKYNDHRDILGNRSKFASFYLIPLLIAHPILLARFFPSSSEGGMRIWRLMPLAAVVALVGTPEPVRIYNDISGRTSLKSLPIQALLALVSLALHTAPLFLVDTNTFMLQQSVTDPKSVATSAAVLAPFLAYYLLSGGWPYSSDPVSMLALMLAFLAVRRASSIKKALPPAFPKLVLAVSILSTVVIFAIPAKILSASAQTADPDDCLRAPQPTRESQFDFIIDVRTENERRILGAHARSLHLPIQGITKDKVVQLVGSATESRIRILTYCNTATRARDAAQLIRSYGFPYTFYHPGTWDTIKS